MFEWELLIGAVLYALTNVFLPVAITFTIDQFMHYGHILGFVRENHAKYVVATSEDPVLQSLKDDIDEAANWVDKIDAANDLYWGIAANDRKMKLLICPVCLGTRISFLTCFFVSVAASIFFGLPFLKMVLLTAGTLIFCIPFTVWFIGSKF